MNHNLIEQLNLSVANILAHCRENGLNWREHMRFEIVIDGVTWVNRYGHNNNPWDLWLTKKGTLGKRFHTFRRLYAKVRDCN